MTMMTRVKMLIRIKMQILRLLITMMMIVKFFANNTHADVGLAEKNDGDDEEVIDNNDNDDGDAEINDNDEEVVGNNDDDEEVVDNNDDDDGDADNKDDGPPESVCPAGVLIPAGREGSIIQNYSEAHTQILMHRLFSVKKTLDLLRTEGISKLSSLYYKEM